VVFIPKSRKLLSQAKSLQPISLMSFILKILEKLLDRHMKGGVLVEKPLHLYQFAYRAGMSTETALFRVVHRLETSLKHKEMSFFFLGSWFRVCWIMGFTVQLDNTYWFSCFYYLHSTCFGNLICHLQDRHCTLGLRF
jgi:hypothetical protein